MRFNLHETTSLLTSDWSLSPTAGYPVASKSLTRNSWRLNQQLNSHNIKTLTLSTKATAASRRRPRAAAAADRRRKIVSGQFDEENPFMLISSVLLVQPDEGVSDLVVDRIGSSAAACGDPSTVCDRACATARFAPDSHAMASRPADLLRTGCARLERQACCRAPRVACDRRHRRACGCATAVERAAMRRTKYGDRPWAIGRRLGRCGRTLGDAGRTLSSANAPLKRAASRDGPRTAAANFSWWRRRRRRPPLRRRSGDVVTAGLNSSRVWFGPVPGSP
ncbi:hypothetical protein F511_06470 [Dorcoceras hygrometricum]|uniref:Uncharacterized protein n=1 Tax=Dorcoceras hygrometricum TaxID=472368 RepID=A0A2Z7BZP6_9LAMI|nr:hypothetical protein F511_06470 [Dorcoceras hygrometricum]